MLVKSELQKLGVENAVVELGEVEIKKDLTKEQLDKFKITLFRSGLELMPDKNSNLIERIKMVIVEIVNTENDGHKENFSDIISQKLDHDYTYLANLYSEVTGMTIEHFLILYKIEKVKELLLYNELNLTEISYKLNYSSVAHLSNQFKKVTGLTPTFFKKLKLQRRSLPV